MLRSGKLRTVFFMIMCEGVTTIRNGVGPSGPKRVTTHVVDDIVCSVWQHTAPWQKSNDLL